MDVRLAILIALQVLVVGSTIVDIPDLGKLQGTTTKTLWTNQTVF
jgi:hypothetical protein